jgi:hypothetical protein
MAVQAVPAIKHVKPYLKKNQCKKGQEHGSSGKISRHYLVEVLSSTPSTAQNNSYKEKSALPAMRLTST